MSCTRPPRCTKAPSAARSTATRAIKNCPPDSERRGGGNGFNTEPRSNGAEQRAVRRAARAAGRHARSAEAEKQANVGVSRVACFRLRRFARAAFGGQSNGFVSLVNFVAEPSPLLRRSV